MRVLVLAVALFFLLPVKWSFCSPNDISVHFKEFVVRDGRWGAKFSLKNNTRDHVVTHIDYRGEYKKDGKKNALVIWLHGAGEGGTDTSIDLLANEVTAMAGDQFQKDMNDAYVIAPQCPTMWMDGGNGEYQNGDKGSIYAKGLFDLIDTYVKNNPDVDTSKIYIGGCSNGGYMTMEMILKHPDYFAAAFPICEAYQDQYITDAEINAIKYMPIWFTFAKTDTTVDYTLCTEPTLKRLLAAGAKNVHVSAFDDVRDTLKELKKKYKIAVLTNGNASSQRRKLNTINIYDLLDYSLVSSEYGVRKPDKKIFEYTAKQLDLKTEECSYVGDNYKIDILGSRNAGMLPVFISRNNEIHEDVLCIQTINELLQHF